jgi:hypothetical protein
MTNTLSTIHSLALFRRTAAAVSLLVALFLGASAPLVRAQAEAAPPERVLRDFYQWYVGQLVAERDPFTAGRAELKRYASDRLLKQIDKARKVEGGIGSDPFLDAQDFDKQWAKNVTVSTPEVKAEKATANVELKGSEMGTQKLKIALVQENGSWKIDKVESR